MNIFDTILPLFTGLGGIGLLLGAFFAWKTGFLEFLLKIKKNGSGSYSRFDKLDEQLDSIANNHFNDVGDSLRRIESLLEKINDRLIYNSENIVHIRARLNGKINE